jgi:hypothetical protein
LAPTSLGLQLFARCHGHRGATEDFYGVPNLPDLANEVSRSDESAPRGR